MTAYRQIDDHNELINIGSISHDQIDSFISGSAFTVVSGSTHLPPAARQLKAGNGVSLIDEGPGGHLIISTTTSTSLSGTLVSWMETPSGDLNGSNTLFNLINQPLPSGSLMLFVNGLLQKQGPDADYVVSGTLVNLSSPPRTDSNVIATYPYTVSGGGFAWMEPVTGTIDGTNVVFTLSNIPIFGSLMLFVNGVLQKHGLDADYTLVGTTVTLSYPPRIDSNILASYPY